ncbi:uroporphyrinogen decarboxylase [Escherichia coli]|uniref:Uroporphyrinogen decarboxylase n=1 Tax=Escherichia coli TaxID=562 RepID=A0A377CWL1_ECOLX|nr:uroporphyrinogen decarboxylase [Escherichia coli]
MPLIGFSGSPVDAGDLHGGRRQQQSVHRDQKNGCMPIPQALHALLDKLAKSVTLYLNAQIKAGAQAVMIFDTWAVCLPGAIINSSRSITCINC